MDRFCGQGFYPSGNLTAVTWYRMVDHLHEILASTTAEEDYVRYARFRGLSEFTIGKNYVMRNSILTQITALAMSLGGVFGGSIMTEIIFGYPGVGSLIQAAILQSDYNMILGCITISIVAIASATLIVDLIYPFIDPRIRYG